MKLSISNIAWEPDEDEVIAEILNEHKIDAIDVAPGKYFPSIPDAKDSDVFAVRQWWSDRGISICGMQSLLFGTQGLNVFGSAAVQERMLQYLSSVCRVGSILGATSLVFGSPKNRDRTGLADDVVKDIALDFFYRLGNIAGSHGVEICLEPNPVCYGANFMTTTHEAAEVVSQLAHPSIKMQFDTGTITENGEDPVEILHQYARLVGHIHASEINLVPLGDGVANHSEIAKAVERFLPGHTVTVEMLATKGEPHAKSVERAVGVAISHYRNGM